MYEYNAKLARVIDGDTVVLEVDLGMWTYRVVPCRLWGINAPEPKGATKADGDAATAHLEWLIEDRGVSHIQTEKDRGDKYGRYLVRIYPCKGDVTINEMMVEDGFAVRKEY